MKYKPLVWNRGQPKGTLCEFCLNAVPNDTYGCEWSDFGEPVDGWKAIPTSFIDCLMNKPSGEVDIRTVHSYCVIKCPKFILSRIGYIPKSESIPLIEEEGDEPLGIFRINKKNAPTLLCKYNNGVDCENRSRCIPCGWNPTNIKERKKSIRKSFT